MRTGHVLFGPKISLAKICWCLKSHLALAIREYTCLNSNPVKMYRMDEYMRNSLLCRRFPNKEMFTTASRKHAKKITWTVCLPKYHVVLFLQVESDSIGWSSPFNCRARLQISKATNTYWTHGQHNSYSIWVSYL